MHTCVVLSGFFLINKNCCKGNRRTRVRLRELANGIKQTTNLTNKSLTTMTTTTTTSTIIVDLDVIFVFVVVINSVSSSGMNVHAKLNYAKGWVLNYEHLLSLENSLNYHVLYFIAQNLLAGELWCFERSRWLYNLKLFYAGIFNVTS